MACAKHLLTQIHLQDAVGFYYVCKGCEEFALCFKCYHSRHMIHSDHEFERRGVEFPEVEEGEGTEADAEEGTEAGDGSSHDGSESSEQGTNADSDSGDS